jgi:class 3 adenylate cyclase
MTPNIQFLRRDDGVRLAYSVFGDGPPFVVTSPWVSNLALSFEDPFFMNFWNEISKSCTIVLYDKHGCGQSDRDRKTFNADSELLDLKTVIEQLTIAFTDIVSSTNLITQYGDAKSRDIFINHDKIIRQQIAKYGGRELQNLGDGFMLAFKSASSCIKCSCAIRNEIAKSFPMIDIKIGINTGEVVIREKKHPFGQAVVIASRIVDKCQGNQILVSDLTKQLVAGSKFYFLRSDEFTPKGFDESLLVHEVICDNLLECT